MRLLFFFCTILLLISCSNNSAISKKLSGCDSLIINFTDSSSGAVVRSVETTEITAIKKLRQFVNGKKAEDFKCGYNGNLLFFEKGKLVSDISFNYAEGCRHFLLSVEEKLASTNMSNEAADFLKGLAEGRDWY